MANSFRGRSGFEIKGPVQPEGNGENRLVGGTDQDVRPVERHADAGALGLDGELGHVDGNATSASPHQDGLARVDGELLERGQRGLARRRDGARPAPRLEYRLVHELTRLEIARAGDHDGVDEEAEDGDPEEPADGGTDSHA